MLSEFMVRLRALLRRDQTDAERNEEILYHLDREIERNIANGMSPGDARTAAHRAFGNATVVSEQARDAWAWRWIEELRQDCAYALRTFSRAPAFAITVIATIGLGLGLLSAVFTFFYAYVLRPVAARDPHSLYELHWSSADGQAHQFSWNQFQRLSKDRSVFAEVYASRFLAPRVKEHSTRAQLVSGNYFDMLGVPPALGRTLGPTDAASEGAEPVLVLSHRGWMGLFGGDSTVIGQRVSVAGSRFEIVGVAREGFGGLTNAPFDFWLPITMAPTVGQAPVLFRQADDESIGVVGRLAPGVTEARAHAWFRDWLAAATAERPAIHRMQDVSLVSRATSIPPSPETAAIFAPAIIAFLLVMLIACANVANLLLARGMARQREIGIRLALGAGRPRIIRQLLVEALLLALPAAAFGLFLSRLTLSAVIQLLYATLPSDAADFVRLIPLDSDILALLTLVLAAVVFGLAPALQASRPNIVQASRGDFDTQFRPSRLRNALVMVQVSMSVLLLIVAGVLLSASRNVARLDPGVRTASVFQLELLAPFRTSGIETLQNDREVRDVATANSTLIDACCPKVFVQTAERRAERINYLAVSSNWFSTFDLPIVRGRVFTSDESRGRAPVAIVSQSTARRLWPNDDPIGRTLSIPVSDPDYRRLTSYREVRVIGVARDAASEWIGAGRNIPIVYFPQPIDASSARLVVRMQGQSGHDKQELERALAKVDSAAVVEIHSLDDALAVQAYPFRAMYWVASALGVVALTLTLIGVYGVVSYLVAQRRKEFGVRLALGAANRSIVTLVIRQTMRLAVIGLFAGLALALGTSRLFMSFIPSLNTFDAWGYAFGSTLVLLACVAAALAPAYRASTVNPVEALRADS